VNGPGDFDNHAEHQSLRSWLRLLLPILSCAGFIVPRSERPEWIAEWTGEFWYLLHSDSAAKSPFLQVQRSAISFCLGSFRDAIWLRANRSDSMGEERLWLRSPVRCVVFLSILAALAAGIA
jgi:hypothetical protein